MQDDRLQICLKSTPSLIHPPSYNIILKDRAPCIHITIRRTQHSIEVGTVPTYLPYPPTDPRERYQNAVPAAARSVRHLPVYSIYHPRHPAPEVSKGRMIWHGMYMYCTAQEREKKRKEKKRKKKRQDRKSVV